MSPRPGLLALALTGAFTLACTGPREAGPNEDEFGQVLFWEVQSIEPSQEGCTDAPDFQEALTLPPLEDGTFFMYQLADDGSTAQAMDCGELDADSCSPVPGIVFEVDGASMVAAVEPVPLDTANGCTVSLQETWTFDDGGEEGLLTFALSFPFDGPASACDDLDADIAAEGTNGSGLADCQVGFGASVLFTLADD